MESKKENPKINSLSLHTDFIKIKVKYTKRINQWNIVWNEKNVSTIQKFENNFILIFYKRFEKSNECLFSWL